jgi:hypothetical protein
MRADGSRATNHGLLRGAFLIDIVDLARSRFSLTDGGAVLSEVSGRTGGEANDSRRRKDDGGMELESAVVG